MIRLAILQCRQLLNIAFKARRIGPMKIKPQLYNEIISEIAFRNLGRRPCRPRHRGLASGLGVCLLIVLYVTDELSYDRYNVNAGRIYRIDEDLCQITPRCTMPPPLNLAGPISSLPSGDPMNGEFTAGSLHWCGKPSNVDDHFTLPTHDLQVFTLPLIAGDPNTALNNPRSIVIDESAARRCFNGTDVIGPHAEVDK